ncbi:sensor domain-containing protein [Rhodopirellula bahusiensis]|uniref:Uncharacterized protein n=1 Tax=Rhodopirellula bahusiensis TaxID=2014065 RepID=A0A2G1WD74_9BACT|nr:hypothetical protein [Rhodopirellula bahusiensis]PHQ36977.1 hypothetical protein CEE69_00955 [Rhodopirellula bahusiensis]
MSDINPEEANQLREEISEYRAAIQQFRDLPDPLGKFARTSRLVEKVIKTHFPPVEPEVSSLGGLLHSRKDFLGKKKFRKAAFAIDIRNLELHYDPDREATEADANKATRILFEIIELHCKELEKGLPRTTEAIDPAETRQFPTTTRATLPLPELVAYATRIERKSPPMLDADEADPHVTASTLAEYTFCPRAGVLTHEGSFSDPEEELPSLALLPWYEQAAIEEAYTHALYVLFAFPVGLVAAVVILSLMLLGNPVYPLLLIGLVLGWTIFAWRAFRRWREIGNRRLAAQLANECNPVPGKNTFQPVDWWGLLLAGYEVRRPQAALHDERWKLSGKPRRILDKGTMSIPVHRIRKPEGPVLPQHIVRVMAHCHLIEATEGANSPFGIVLFGNTYQGMTVPNTNEHRERFYTALERVRAMIIESDAGERQPPEPVTGNVCSSCHFGHPRSIAHEDKTMRYEEPLDPVLFHNGKKAFHCDCGDRFNWKPKHDRNRKMRRLE